MLRLTLRIESWLPFMLETIEVMRAMGYELDEEEVTTVIRMACWVEVVECV